MEPGVEIVDGFPPAMPPYADRIPEEDLTGLLDYLEGLKADSQQEIETEESTAPSADEPTVEEKREQPAAAVVEEPLDLASQGRSLAEQNGCLGCHSTDGTRRVGPSLKGLMGRERTVVKEGQDVTVSADTGYLIRAIREPGAEVVQGYPAAMPPFPGFSDEEIEALQAWLETLK
jgi:cytochrome c oxidase subunit 2